MVPMPIVTFLCTFLCAPAGRRVPACACGQPGPTGPEGAVRGRGVVGAGATAGGPGARPEIRHTTAAGQ